MGKTFLINQFKVIYEHLIIYKKLQQVKGMITQLVVCLIIISKSIIKEAKETVLDFLQWTVSILILFFALI